jgi:hypothetical protein
MALPTDLPSDAEAPPGPSRPGPFIFGGNVYHVTRRAAATDELAVWKASDPEGGSFAEQDGANSPNLGSAILSLAVRQLGSVLYMLTIVVDGSNNWRIAFHDFDMSDDTWGTTDQLAHSFTDANVNHGTESAFVDLAPVRSGGDLVGCCLDATDAVHNTDYNRVAFLRRISGTWTASTAFATGASDSYFFGKIDGYATRYHLFSVWSAQATGGAKELHQQSIRSSDWGLGTEQTPTTLDIYATAPLPSPGNTVTWDNGGTERVMCPFFTATPRSSVIWTTNEADDPTWAEQDLNLDDCEVSGTNAGEYHHVQLKDGLSSNSYEHAIGVEDDSSRTKRDENNPGGSPNWNTTADTDIETALSTYDGIWGNIYQRGTEVRLAHVRRVTSGQLTYNEVDLGAGPVTTSDPIVSTAYKQLLPRF